MDIKTNYFKTEKTARFVTYGNLSAKTKYFWFCLHGSKMLCEQMLYKFSDFDPNTHYVVAPEALNRFYANGFGGDVVAAWMTKRDRLHEIDDFSHFLSTLYRSIDKKLHPKCKKIVLGFSQGGTMAFRWLNANGHAIDLLLAYSCWIPEDIDLSQFHTQINNGKMVYTYGLQDQFLTPEKVNEVSQIIQKNDLEVELEPYEGLHRISKTNLQRIFENYVL